MKLLDSPLVLTAGAPYDGSLRGRERGGLESQVDPPVIMPAV